MDEIYLSDISHTGDLATICLTAMLIIALGFRLLTNQRRKISEQRRNYHCITCKMSWGASDNPVDEDIGRIGA